MQAVILLHQAGHLLHLLSHNYYPLTGAHALIQGNCAACHSNGNYSNTPNTCNGCHNANYAATTNPNHVALGLSTDCASCHTTAPGWSPAMFTIHDNYYPLTGAHASIAGDCAACHANGNYSNTPNTCNGCHNANYTSATNPNHVALGLSTDCASCHTTALVGRQRHLLFTIILSIDGSACEYSK